MILTEKTVKTAVYDFEENENHISKIFFVLGIMLTGVSVWWAIAARNEGRIWLLGVLGAVIGLGTVVTAFVMHRSAKKVQPSTDYIIVKAQCVDRTVSTDNDSGVSSHRIQLYYPKFRKTFAYGVDDDMYKYAVVGFLYYVVLIPKGSFFGEKRYRFVDMYNIDNYELDETLKNEKYKE